MGSRALTAPLQLAEPCHCLTYHHPLSLGWDPSSHARTCLRSSLVGYHRRRESTTATTATIPSTISTPAATIVVTASFVVIAPPPLSWLACQTPSPYKATPSTYKTSNTATHTPR